MDVQWAAAAIDQNKARKLFERGQRRSLFSPFRWLARQPKQTRLELVYLPCRVVFLSAEEKDAAGFVLVNGYARQAQAVREKLPTIEEPAGWLRFNYPLSDQESLAIARASFLSWKLGRIAGGPRDSADFVLGYLLHYPYWANYVESPSGRIALNLLDGVTARPGGVMMKQAFLEAMKRQSD